MKTLNDEYIKEKYKDNINDLKLNGYVLYSKKYEFKDEDVVYYASLFLEEGNQLHKCKYKEIKNMNMRKFKTEDECLSYINYFNNFSKLMDKIILDKVEEEIENFVDVRDLSFNNKNIYTTNKK